MGDRILIVDDHAGFRASARRALEADGFTVVGEAANAADALTVAAGSAPDLVLLDVHLPDRNGTEIAAALSDGAGHPDVVLVSSHDADDIAALARGCGARAFLPKEELSGDALARLLDGPAPGGDLPLGL